jgi:hypothetical protein
MGIKDVKARLPFTLEDMFKLDRVVIDAANLMFLAMLKQAKAGFTEDLDPALNEFQSLAPAADPPNRIAPTLSSRRHSSTARVESQAGSSVECVTLTMAPGWVNDLMHY